MSYVGPNPPPRMGLPGDHLESDAGNFPENNVAAHYERAAIPLANSLPNSYSVPISDEEILPSIRQKQMVSQRSVYLSQLKSRGEDLAEKGDFANAMKYFEQIVNLDPEDGQTWTSLGHCYLLTDEPLKAFGAYQKALQYSSGSYDLSLWYAIGMIYNKVKVSIILV
jgi:tetratricopeptide (TPR) repeat protein